MRMNRDELPVYTTTPSTPVERPIPPDPPTPDVVDEQLAVDHAPAGVSGPRLRHSNRRTRRAVRAAYRRPLAVLPWLGVVATIVWAPLAVLAALALVGSYRHNHRGVAAAAAALIVVLAIHWFSGHLIKPIF